MKPIDAALSAFYPLLVIMGALIVLRFLTLLPHVAPNTRPLICSSLLIVIGVMWEQILYGYGRFSGLYITIATSPGLVAIGKVVLASGLAYQLYAFWLLSPAKPKLWVSFVFAGFTWMVIFMLLLF